MMGFIGRLLERRRMEREGQLGTRKRRTDSIWGEAADRSPILTIALVLVLLVVCMTVLTLPELRHYPELVPNQLAPSTIFAGVDFSYEDKAATAAKREESTVMQPRYFQLSQTSNEQINKRWQMLLDFVHERRKLESQEKVFSAPDTPVAQEIAALSPGAFLILSQLDKDPLLREQFRDELLRICNDGIIDLSKLTNPAPDSPVRLVDSAGRDRMKRTLKSLLTCEEASKQLSKLLLSYTPEQKAAALDRAALERLMHTLLGDGGNLVLDSKRTIARRESAIKAVQPVMREVSKNDVIIKRNTPVTPMVLDALAAQKAVLEMHNQEDDRWQNFWHNMFWSLTMILFAGFYLAHIHPEITRSSAGSP